MLVSIFLGAAMLQQDADGAKAKWAEVRAVWDGYAAVTGEMSSVNEVYVFAVRRDGRYLIKTIQNVKGQARSEAMLLSIEQFDGATRINFNALTNEYVVSHDDEPPKWVAPFLRLWGKRPVAEPFDQYDLRLVNDEHQDDGGLIGFLHMFLSSDGGIGLRNRDYTPLFSAEFLLVFGSSVEVHRYPLCKPIVYERHCDREFEWSLPPGARLVERLNGDR